MSYCDAYIGYLDDPYFRWGEGEGTGRPPKRVSPFFPPAYTRAYGIFSVIIERINDKTFEGKQVDWGAFVAKVSKKQIVELIDEFYPDSWIERNKEYSNHLNIQLVDLKKFVSQLSDEKAYALMACEL